MEIDALLEQKQDDDLDQVEDDDPPAPLEPPVDDVRL